MIWNFIFSFSIIYNRNAIDNSHVCDKKHSTIYTDFSYFQMHVYASNICIFDSKKVGERRAMKFKMVSVHSNSYAIRMITILRNPKQHNRNLFILSTHIWFSRLFQSNVSFSCFSHQAHSHFRECHFDFLFFFFKENTTWCIWSKGKSVQWKWPFKMFAKGNLYLIYAPIIMFPLWSVLRVHLCIQCMYSIYKNAFSHILRYWQCLNWMLLMWKCRILKMQLENAHFHRKKRKFSANIIVIHVEWNDHTGTWDHTYQTTRICIEILWSACQMTIKFEFGRNLMLHLLSLSLSLWIQYNMYFEMILTICKRYGLHVTPYPGDDNNCRNTKPFAI